MNMDAQPKSVYDFTVKAIDGKVFNFSSLKGRKIMIVNTASECGYTPQYAQLEELYKKYGGEKFVIIGFPANNFGSQEPGTNAEIKAFCTKNYGVTFPMMAKVSVKGDDKVAVYQFLTEERFNGKEDSDVKWNFQKYMIDENGNLVGHVAPKESPDCEKIIKWIEGK